MNSVRVWAKQGPCLGHSRLLFHIAKIRLAAVPVMRWLTLVCDSGTFFLKVFFQAASFIPELSTLHLLITVLPTVPRWRVPAVA